jgi:hypothetical protein
MRLFDAESTVLQDLKDECEIIGEREGSGFSVTAARHPTLGKLVLIAAEDGTGVVVETEE